MSQLDRRIKRGVTAAAFGVLAFAATEVLPVAPGVATPQTGKDNQISSTEFKSQPNFFGKIGSRLAAASSESWECLTSLAIGMHARAERSDQDVTGTELVVFNTSNPAEKTVLRAIEPQKYNPNKNYQNNSINPATGERTALLRGNRLATADCNKDDEKCPKTEIGAYETKDGVQVGPVSTLRVDCPPRVCDWTAYWAVEQLPLQPTPTPTNEPRNTPMPINAPPQLPRTGN